jgi:hypothetical protein
MPFAQKVKKSWIAEKFVQKALMVLEFESGANAKRVRSAAAGYICCHP